MPQELWALWGAHWWHPDELIAIALILQAYLLGIGPLRVRYHWAERVERRHVIFFLSGLFVLFLAVASPLHDLSEVLFSAHMTQHVLLMLVVPPLLLLGTPRWLLSPVLRYVLIVPPLRLVRAPTPVLAAAVRHAPLLKLARVLTRPVVALVLFTAAFSLWHIPALYEASVRSDVVHVLEHGMFLVAAVLAWWPILSPSPDELPRLSDPAQMLYLFLFSITTTPVFAVLTFADQSIYPWYETALQAWGIAPLADQQTGGIIMKVPFTIVLLTVLAVVFFRWFDRGYLARDADEEDGEREGYGPPYSYVP